MLNKPTDEQMAYVELQHNFDGKGVWDEIYGVMGLYRFLYTYGILGGCDSQGYHWRWCYKTKLEAELALKDYLEGVTPDEPKGYTRRLPEINFED